MWARDFELALALWLLASPFVFAHPPEASALWSTDLACASVIGVLALASYARRLRRAHLLELLAAVWLIGFGRWTMAHDPTPAAENQIVVGLLVAMLAIVPTEASRPPVAWRR